jgi:nitrite reductase/ring-hydroxylating ferredoxin subunit/uncharacterized membrane protein
MSTATAQSPLSGVTDRIERMSELDPAAQAAARTVRSRIKPGAIKDALSGTWLGHALHPVLTDVVVGSLLSASVLDVIGGRRSQPATQRLIGVGLAAAPVTALTGASDWADAEPRDKAVGRVGAVHGVVNTTALTLYGLSLRARRRDHRAAATALALAGAGVLTAGGYLGAHLSFAEGIGVDQTRFDTGPSDWTPALEDTQLVEGRPRVGLAGETPVLLVRHGGAIRALHDRCMHRGCSLADGTIEDGAVTCACHGSRYRLDDGAVLRGPATRDQPTFDVREQEGRIEVRLRTPAPV